MGIRTEQRLLLKFGPYAADLANRELTKYGARVPLQIQPFQILEAFLERPNQLITREELQRKLWPEGTYIDFEQGLNKAINKLRVALCDTAENPQYVETVPRLGYRFIAQVKNGAQPAPSTQRPEILPATEPESRRPVSLTKGGVLDAVAVSASRRTLGKLNACLVMVCVVFVGVVLYVALAPTVAKLIRLYQLEQLKVTPLTALPGRVASPTFSPDGSQIAFAWEGENAEAGYDLYIKTLGSDKPLRVTNHPSRRLWVAWSPDGRYIAMSRVAGVDDSGIYLIPPTGGPERRLTSKGSFDRNTPGIAWAPDGRLLAFTDHPQNASWEGELQLFTLSLDTLERNQINTGCTLVTAPAFSPKGDLLAWACVDSWSSYSIHAMRLSDGRITRLFERADGIGGLGWSSDGHRIVFTSPLDFGDIWELRLGHPNYANKLPVGHDASELTVAPVRGRLAYVAGNFNVNIWRVDLQDPNPHPRKLIVSSREQKAPDISPDQGRIAFESTRSGSNELWICDADGTNARQLTSFGIRATGTPQWSLDGRTIAFDSRVDGEANIYLIDPNRGVPQKLYVANVHGNNLPSWSRDGKWIYFVHGEDARRPSIWKVPLTGGEAVEIAGSPATYPQESPDGRYVYFVRNSKLWRSNADGSAAGEVRGMPQLKPLGDKWLPYGGGIYYFSDVQGKTALDYLDLTSGRFQRVTVLDMGLPLWMGQMSISSDGKWLLYPQVDARSSNLMMIENWH